jgi:hypothetical protein
MAGVATVDEQFLRLSVRVNVNVNANANAKSATARSRVQCGSHLAHWLRRRLRSLPALKGGTLPNNLAIAADNADMRVVLRRVQSDELFHDLLPELVETVAG